MIGRALVASALAASFAILPAQAQERRPKGTDYITKKICKVESRSGSRLGAKRTCQSQAEWDAAAREAALQVAHIQAGPQPCLMGSNDPTNPNRGVPSCGGGGGP